MKFGLFFSWLLLCLTLFAQSLPQYSDAHEWVKDHVDKHANEWQDVALKIWDFAELGYLEIKSSSLLKMYLKQYGFEIKAVPDIPTAFVATYGKGSPVVGILGEYDALPGLSQAVALERKPIEGQRGGHACGHHLFGTGSLAAVIAAKEWMVKNKKQGTLQFFGCPAEEGGSGKVYMTREGIFSGVDIMLHWHPSDRNMAVMDAALSNRSGKFRFHGVSAHAAGSPEKGKSALDAVEAMNYMANLMREHIPSSARLHYVITAGGKAPNVVPDFAEVYYYVRHPEKDKVIEIWKRLVKVAQGAALGTQTTFDVEIIGGTYNLLPNEPLAKRMYENLKEVGGVNYTQEELQFAKKIASTIVGNASDLSSAVEIQPFETERLGMGSTDVGDVSWNIPTTGLRTATWVPGTSAHSWQAVAAGGSSIGIKGMIVASKTLACTLVDALTNPQLVQDAKADFIKRRGTHFHYEAIVGNRPPPLDYRK